MGRHKKNPTKEDIYIDKGNETIQEVKLLSGSALAVIVSTDVEFAAAVEVMAKIAHAKKAVEKFFDEGVKKAREAYQHLLKQKKFYMTPLEEGDQHIRNQIVTYEQHKEKDREAELARIKLMMENQNTIKNIYGDQIDAHDRNLLAEAAKIVVMNPINKIETASAICKVVISYKAEVVDFKQMVRAIVNGEIPYEMVEPNQKLLDKMAGSLRSAFFYPGVRVITIHTPYLFTKDQDKFPEEIEL
jgi:hypothetical protein